MEGKEKEDNLFLLQRQVLHLMFDLLNNLIKLGKKCKTTEKKIIFFYVV